MKFRFPDVGEGITEAEIVEWLTKVGETVKEDQPLVKIETDKAVVEIPSPQQGKILRLYHKVGEKIKVGDVLLEISGEGKERTTSSVVGQLAEAAEPSKEKPTSELQGLAQMWGINTDKLNIQKTSQKKVATKKKYDFYGYVERIPLKGIRKTIKENMALQAAIPQVTHIDEADITALARIRETEKKNAAKKKIKLTYLAYIVKAVIKALQKHPYLNSSLVDEEIVLKKYYNIGIAVATKQGLLVPVIKGADKKNLYTLAKEISELAEKARSRKIDLQDLKGGCFTITNVGSVGGIFSTPILNTEESGILAVGQIYDKAVPIKNKVVVRKMLPLSLTFDHRILDGANAASFMNGVKELLETPKMLNSS